MPKMNDPGKRITTVWLFVAIDEDGDEGLPAFSVGNMMMPMVASDEKRRDILLAQAQVMVESIPGNRIEVRRFDGAYTVETVIE